MTRHITAHDFIGALVDAGILRAGDGIRRIVIDAHIGHPVVLHVQRHADQRLLDVVPGLDGVEIREQAKPPMPSPERPIDLDDRAPRPQPAGKTAEQVAQLFHETYELLAPRFGYRTREASAKPWSEVPEQNKALMIATCARVLVALNGGPDAPPSPPKPPRLPNRPFA